MERLLRSVIQVGGQPDGEDCTHNWNRLQEYALEFRSEEDRHIHEYLIKFYGQMSAPPDFALVKEYFEKIDDVETVTRLDEIKKAQCYIRTNYLAILRAEQEQQQIKDLAVLCRDVSAIAEHGRNLDKPLNGKKVIRGVHDAVNFLYERLPEFTRIENGEKLEGVVSEDAEEFLSDYDHITKTNTYAGRNLFGLEPVDSVCEGHRSGEYWVHCAFTGELKTTVALNYAYNNSYLFGKNIFYAILEMPYKQLRNQIYVLHSSHGKFVTDWYDQDRRAGKPPKECYIGLDYRKVRDGKLDEVALKRLKIISQDFKTTCKGKFYVWRPDDEVGILDIRRKAEMFHNKYGCDGVIIDNLSNVRPRHRTNDFVVSINNVVRDGRMMALNFARGKTVPVLALFHLNRQGKLRADKNDGRYDMASIAYANEIDKSADVITYTYLNDQLRNEGKFYLGNLKNRDNPMFDRMVGKILWQSKRMRAIETGLLDFNNDRLMLAASKQISLGVDDMMLS
jgi:replicative DNA helicase